MLSSLGREKDIYVNLTLRYVSRVCRSAIVHKEEKSLHYKEVTLVVFLTIERVILTLVKVCIRSVKDVLEDCLVEIEVKRGCPRPADFHPTYGA